MSEASAAGGQQASEEQRLAPLRCGKFRFTVDGLQLVDGPPPTFEEWADACHVAAIFAGSVQMLVGDLMNFGEARFSERASQVVDSEHWQEETVRVYRWVAASVPAEVRMLDRLSFKHHQLVAGLSPKEQRKWLERALGNGDGRWTTARLAAALREGDDAPVTAVWLMVLCKDQQERARVQLWLEQQGAIVKQQERRNREEKPRKKPRATGEAKAKERRAAARETARDRREITARAKRPGRRRARSAG